jgi:hypothetical protein
MASNAVPCCLKDGIAPEDTKAMLVLRLLGEETEDAYLAPRVQQHLFQPHGIVTIADLKECPKAEVITRITAANAAAYAMGMVSMIKRFIFLPTEDCERIIPTPMPPVFVPTPMPPALQMPQRCRVPPQGLCRRA